MKNFRHASMLPKRCRNVGSLEFSWTSPSWKFSAAVMAEKVWPARLARAEAFSFSPRASALASARSPSALAVA